MIHRLLLLLMTPSCLSATGNRNPTAVRLITIYPHNVSAFTEGLVFDNGALIESTGLSGESFIRKYNVADLHTDYFKTGSIQALPLLQEFRFNDTFFGEGVTVLGETLFALTYKAKQLVMLSRHDFSFLGQFSLVTSTKQGWGLTTDGNFLIVSDGSAEVQFYYPRNDFRLHHSITVRKDGMPVKNVNELEYVRDELLANVWFGNHILRINVTTGDVFEQIDLSWIPNMVSNIHAETMKPSLRREAVMNGIAYDPVTRHIFLTGKLWDSMFELELSYLL
ncbi:hypothetical protein PsorP6_004137 [Peronosclerospora sorghi]|uniref:Uncharacterized protein n=1 Tax=Peronosclerospora sorghi TaxID=230839 RepID=A0ACC0VM81_9STRA|nr:hypothetical protein PsorP6_004137 [Peronosclerospora sorghi]